jgi:hypothetical protein
MNMCLWKESLNSDGKTNPIKYQQNDLNLEQLITRPYTIPGSGLGQTQQCDGVKPLKGIPSPSHNWISIDNININKQWKVCINSLSLQKTRHYHKIELQHTHGQYDSRINACSSLLAIGQLAKKVESAS